MRLRTAILYVKDFQRMTRFYSEAFEIGPRTSQSSDNWAFFDIGETGFALHAIPAELANSIDIACPPVPREQIPVKLIFDVQDVEETRTRLELLGARSLRRPWQKPGEACDLADPEGNVFQICTRDSHSR